MHIRVNRDILLQAFAHSQSVIEKRTTLLILGHTLIEARGSSISLVSTDMDLSLSETIACEVEEEGSLCVPTILMYEILRKLSSGVPVDLLFDGSSTQVVLSAGRSRFNIPCIASEEFPRVLHADESYPCHFTLPAPILKNMLETVSFSMSSDEMRYALNGINLSYVDATKRVRAVATDRHRLACIEIEALEGVEKLPSIIIGKKTITEMVRLLDEATDPVSLAISDTRIELTVQSEHSTAILGSRLVDGSFPEYEMILNMDYTHKMIATTKGFAEAIDRVGTVINDKARMIQLVLSRNLMKCTTAANTVSEAVEDIDVDYDEGPDTTFSFNARYLLEIAQHIGTEELEFSFADSNMAIGLRPVGVDGVYFALMPLAPQATYTETPTA